ncbi:hypothetical protein WA026_008555, partial [Henosepilachna vigintioctopunctata]
PPQITPFTFGDEPINSGDTVSIQCTVSKGDSPLNISWLLNEKLIHSSDGITLMKMKRFSTLNIDSVQAIHSGKYTCLVKNIAGDESFSAYLNVNVKPQIAHFDFGEETLNTGDTASIQCTVTKGDSPVEIEWLLNKEKINGIHGISTNRIGKKISSLSIESVQAFHTGEYTCVASNVAGVTNYSTYLAVNVRFLIAIAFPVPPQIHPFDFGEESANSGDMTIVTCAATKGDVPLDIFWLLDGKPAQDVQGISVVASKKRVSQLSIDDVQAHHSGTYTCIAMNKAGNASFSAELKVNVPPQIHPFDVGDESVNSGDMTMLTCMVTKGDFPLNIYWTLNDRPTTDYDGITVMTPKQRISQLSIDDIRAHHAGRYTCIAENKAGNASFSVELHVNVAPQIHPFDFGESAVDANEVVIATCVVSKGDFPMTIYWLFNEKPIEKTDGITTMNTNKRASQLTIENVKAQHIGEYSCIAENKAGSVKYSANLSVNGMTCLRRGT